MANPFEKSSEFFSGAFSKLQDASGKESARQRSEFLGERYAADADQASLYGAVPPEQGPYGEDQGPFDEVESVKRDLLDKSMRRKASTNGSFVFRAGGGINPAIKS
jgi:hypothetical protein